MALKEFCLVLICIIVIIIPIIFFSIGCSEKPTSHVLSNIEDNAVFKIYSQNSLIGTLENSIDLKGNYHRNITLSMAGRNVQMTMDITPDQYGEWNIVESKNSIAGTIYAHRIKNRADIFIKGVRRTVELPEGDYTYYDDFGNLFESVMLKKYDMVKKGKQVFQRFRIPEVPEMGGYNLEVEVEFLGKREKVIAGNQWEFLLFNYKALDMNIQFWMGEDYKIYMNYAPLHQLASIREGFEELLPK